MLRNRRREASHDHEDSSLQHGKFGIIQAPLKLEYNYNFLQTSPLTPNTSFCALCILPRHLNQTQLLSHPNPSISTSPLQALPLPLRPKPPPRTPNLPCSAFSPGKQPHVYPPSPLSLLAPFKFNFSVNFGFDTGGSIPSTLASVGRFGGFKNGLGAAMTPEALLMLSSRFGIGDTITGGMTRFGIGVVRTRSV